MERWEEQYEKDGRASRERWVGEYGRKEVFKGAGGSIYVGNAKVQSIGLDCSEFDIH